MFCFHCGSAVTVTEKSKWVKSKEMLARGENLSSRTNTSVSEIRQFRRLEKYFFFHIVTSLVINVPTWAILAVETKGVLFLWLGHLNNKGNVCKQISVPMGTHQNTPCSDVDAKLYPLHSFESKMLLWNFSSTLIPWVNLKFTFAAKL